MKGIKTMADTNKKPVDGAPATEKASKKTEKKPNIFARIGKRIAKFFRDYASECKKIVWLSWKETRRNSLIVIVAVAIFTVVIGALDYGFSQGIIALGKLISL